MNEQIPQKVCPRCNTPAPVSAASCANCGHKYRTKFNVPEPEATQLFTVPRERKSDILLPAATGIAPVFMPLNDPETPFSGFNELNELAYQYRAINWWLLTGIVTSVLLMGIPVLIYAILQKPALLRRVAEYGIDAKAWAAPFDQVFHRNLMIAVAIAGVLVGGLITMAILHGTI